MCHTRLPLLINTRLQPGVGGQRCNTQLFQQFGPHPDKPFKPLEALGLFLTVLKPRCAPVLTT